MLQETAGPLGGRDGPGDGLNESGRQLAGRGHLDPQRERLLRDAARVVVEDLLGVHREGVRREPLLALVQPAGGLAFPGQPPVEGGQGQQRLRELRRHQHRQDGDRQHHGHRARRQRRVQRGPVVVGPVERHGGVVVAHARVWPGRQADPLVPGDDRGIHVPRERGEQPGHLVRVLDERRGHMTGDRGVYLPAQPLGPRRHRVHAAAPDAPE